MSKSKKVTLFNPTEMNFRFQYDVKGDRNPKGFIIYAMEEASFVPFVAKHAEKHLINHVLNIRGLDSRVEKNIKDISKEIKQE